MLFVEKSVFEQLIAAVEMVPEESCGFLFGQSGDSSTQICKFMPVSNVSPDCKEVRFEIASRDFLVAERLAEKDNLELTGIYHTHLIDSAYPSETDRMSAFPNFSYLIISLPNLRFSEMRFWRLNSNNQFEEEVFEILN
ncbi:M67 family metallopeptidase [Algoriphagus aestuariicola]|uniref:M67 family metallopeptidase n=1 Tax=Algoriphagus aestuariicola TaxID=1852016 RepID=A0ABS3BRL2_9BACT|nr:M67 family metallopeptidase [Algoriphagus aestuariicola]MBN7801484.1 M67 family metallopeptidase [Algoriphagus aestuariicola]